MQEASRKDEPELINAPEAAVLPTRQQLRAKAAVENVVADDGRVFVPEMVNGMKIWDVEVHRNDEYHWYWGDVNWRAFPDPPAVRSVVPARPRSNILNLQHMHPILVSSKCGS